MNIALSFALVLLAQPGHSHGEGLAVTGDGPAVLVARTASRLGPFGHLALLNERLEPVALAEVGRVTGWAVRREEPSLVATLESAGTGEAILRTFDGRTLAPVARPRVLEHVARGTGPLGGRGVLSFTGDGGRSLLVLGDPLEAPAERGAPTLWAHVLDDDSLQGTDVVGFPSPGDGPYSLAGAADPSFAVFVGSKSVTCVDLTRGAGESFELPPVSGAPASLADVLVESGTPRVTVWRGAVADVLDPRLGDWARRPVPEHEATPSESTLERRVERTSGDVVTWDRTNGMIELAGGTAPPSALPESLKDLAWLAAPERFPASWVGRWRGPLAVRTPGAAEPRTVRMTLDVAATDDPTRWRFALTYDDGRSSEVRDYRLVLVDRPRGRWIVDEQNGIEIESWYVPDELTQVFAVGPSHLLMRWRRDGDALTFEVTSYAVSGSSESDEPDEPPASGGDGPPAVRSFPVTGVQRAKLERVE